MTLSTYIAKAVQPFQHSLKQACYAAIFASTALLVGCGDMQTVYKDSKLEIKVNADATEGHIKKEEEGLPWNILFGREQHYQFAINAAQPLRKLDDITPDMIQLQSYNNDEGLFSIGHEYSDSDNHIVARTKLDYKQEELRQQWPMYAQKVGQWMKR